MKSRIELHQENWVSQLTEERAKSDEWTESHQENWMRFTLMFCCHQPPSNQSIRDSWEPTQPKLATRFPRGMRVELNSQHWKRSSCCIHSSVVNSLLKILFFFFSLYVVLLITLSTTTELKKLRSIKSLLN